MSTDSTKTRMASKKWQELYQLKVKRACHHKSLLFVENVKDHKYVGFLRYLRSKKSKERKSQQWWKWQKNKMWLNKRKDSRIIRSKSVIPNTRQVQKEVIGPIDWHGSQTLECIWILRRLDKQIAGPQFQSFWFGRSGVRP